MQSRTATVIHFFFLTPLINLLLFLNTIVSSCLSALASVHLARPLLDLAAVLILWLQRSCADACRVKENASVSRDETNRERKRNIRTFVLKHLHKSLDAIFAHSQSYREFRFDERAFRSCRNIIYSDAFLFTSRKLISRRGRSRPKINTSQFLCYYNTILTFLFVPSRFYASSNCARIGATRFFRKIFLYDRKYTLH